MGKSTTFIGRLNIYRYLDMDVTIGEDTECSKNYINKPS